MNISRCLTGLLALTLSAIPLCAPSQSFRLAALVANDDIDWNYNNVNIDSFDSTDPLWSTDGLYDPAKSKNQGDIYVGGSIIDPGGIGIAHIYGRVHMTPGGGATIGSLGGIGERSWQTNNPGQIQPGWLIEEAIPAIPTIELPYTSGIVPDSGVVVLTNCVNGTNCAASTNYYDHILYQGDYHAPNLDGHTIVLGHARLVMPNGLNLVGNHLITVVPGGSISIYLGSNSIVNGGGVINQTGRARNVQIHCTTNVTSLSLGGVTSFVGVIIAPQTIVNLNGAGISFREIVGAIAANSIKLNGNLNLHFDESLVAGPVQLSSPSVSLSNQFQFNVTGVPGFNYAVESSPNLRDWTPVITNLSPFTMVDNSFTNYSDRYYRARRSP